MTPNGDLEGDPSSDEGSVDPSSDQGTADPSSDQGTVDPSSDQGTADPSSDQGTADPGGDPGAVPQGTSPSMETTAVVANEREPQDALPADYVPAGAVATHRVRDGEDWASVASLYNVKVDELIRFNFHTTIPEEVNWYLRRNTGCNVSRDNGANWAFSDSADPGLIYIPPAEVIDMDPEVTTVEKPVMQRIQEIADTLTGNPGNRVSKMLAIESLADPYQPVPAPPGIHKDRLWYYNPGAVSYYLQLNTTNDERLGMTKGTNGQAPFDGNIGPGFEQTYNEWRIYPFGDIVARDASSTQSDSSLKIWLEGTDDEIYKSWQEMAGVESHFSLGGGSALGPLVDAFLTHVRALAETPSHLYFVFQHDDDA